MLAQPKGQAFADASARSVEPARVERRWGGGCAGGEMAVELVKV